MPENSAPTAKPKLGAGVAIALIFATVFTLLAFISVWFNRQVLQTSNWTQTSTELLESKNVRDALGVYIVDQIFTNIDVQGELEQNLPPDLKFAAGPATSGLRELALRATDKGLASQQFQGAWADANEKAHVLMLKILDGKGQYVNIDQGVVTVDVKELLTEVAGQIGVSEKLVAKIPASAGSLTVLESSELKTAQNAKRVSDVTAVLFPLLALALYGIAIGAAAGRRRRVIRWAGISWVAVGLLMLMSISIAKQPLVDALASTSAVEPAVIDVYEIATELERSMATSLIVTGLLVFIATFFAGPAKWAVAVRRFSAPYFRDYPTATGAGALLLFLIIIWVAPGMGFRTWIGVLINSILVIGGFIAYRQISIKEFPDEQAADISDWLNEKWDAVKQSVEGRRGGAFPVARKGVGESETLDQIERLADLHDRGALTDDEFKEQKDDLLARQAGKG